MIKIDKGTEIPKRLAVDGVDETKKICEAYDNDPTVYNKEFIPRDNIYNHSSVKTKLKNIQENKCCFCEKGQVDEYGAVEHFRPKGGFRKYLTDKKDKKPGYFWLVFNWENLYFVCGPCNSSHKKTFFPLVDEDKRARNHHDDIEDETPRLVDPGKEDPREHIQFHDEAPIDISKRGDQTIKICGLDRYGLNEDRLEKLGHLRSYRKLLECSAKLPADIIRTAKEYLEIAVKPSAKFSSMAIDFLSKDVSD